MKLKKLVRRLALPVGTFLLFGLGGAVAQVVDVRQACTPDAMRLCSEFIPDEAKITRCMMAKRAQLSIECRSAMAGGRARVRHAYVRHVRVRHVHSYRHHHG